MTTKLAIIATILALSVNNALAAQKMDDCVNTLKPMFQGNCISDYAVVATTAVELGWCLKDKTKYQDIKLSAQDLICNCADCHTIKGNGCMGGDISKALNYINQNKIVGGSYEKFSTQQTKTIDANGPQNYIDCLKYWTPVCDPTQESNCNITPFDPKSTTFCPTQCNRRTDKTVAESKITGALKNAPTKLTSVQSIKSSITNFRPVIGTMEIFEDMDFYLGTDKIYVHNNGQSLGVVNVIIIGHDTDSTTGLDYWTVLVPWDKKWDDTINGQKLRIVAGINHCNLENEAHEIRVSSN